MLARPVAQSLGEALMLCPPWRQQHPPRHKQCHLCSLAGTSYGNFLHQGLGTLVELHNQTASLPDPLIRCVRHRLLFIRCVRQRLLALLVVQWRIRQGIVALGLMLRLSSQAILVAKGLDAKAVASPAVSRDDACSPSLTGHHRSALHVAEVFRGKTCLLRLFVTFRYRNFFPDICCPGHRR